MTRKPAPPSLLSRGAPASRDETAPPVPWWRDDAKLLEAVIRRATDDPAFGKRLMREAASVARSKPALKMELDAAAKGGRSGARATPLAELMMIADMDAVLTNERGGYAKLVAWVSSAFVLAERGAKKRIEKARALAKSMQHLP